VLRTWYLAKYIVIVCGKMVISNCCTSDDVAAAFNKKDTAASGVVRFRLDEVSQA